MCICPRGRGEVIGMLKVGHKRLYLYDIQDNIRELEPMCVLDFYVKLDRQRSGVGRALFDHMLHVRNSTSPHLYSPYEQNSTN